MYILNAEIFKDVPNFEVYMYTQCGRYMPSEILKYMYTLIQRYIYPMR